jgi:purine-binding chemotaxis protein CheW
MDTAMPVPATLRDAVGAADLRIALPLAGAAARPAADAARHQRYVLLTIAETHYAVAEACVTELERVPPITLVPRLPHWMRGVTNMRGDILSVIDMRSFLGLDAHTPPSARMLVVRLLDEPFAAGLLVDAVDRIVAVPAADITAPASSLTGPLAPFLSGMFLIGERLVAVLDLERLLRSSEIRQFDEPNEAEESSC